MKIFIIITHVLIGLVLIFMVYSPFGIFQKISNPTGFWPDYSVSRIVLEYTSGIVIGLLSIVGAVFFKKNKRWAGFILPAMTLLLILGIVLSMATSNNPSDYAWTGGIMVLFASILSIFFISETVYIVRKRQLLM